MNYRQIAETAVLVAANSGHIIEHPSAIPSGPLWQFRTCSIQRTQSWLRILRGDLVLSGPHDITAWQQLRFDGPDTAAVIAEIFVSEILTRLWTGVLIAADQHRGTESAGPIARSVLSNHLVARNAALRILVRDHVLTAGQRENVDRIRRRSERWSDLLVSHLVCRYGLTDIVHEQRRACDFGEDRLSQGALHPRSAVWSLTRAGMHAAFPSKDSLSVSQCTRFHRGITRSIFATFAALDVAQRRTVKSQ